MIGMLTTTPKTKDEEHKNMIKCFIEYNYSSGYKLFETEYKFNYYGDRGYIDLLTVDKNDPPWVSIYEFKTDILDVGDTIRQVKKYAQNTKRIYKPAVLVCEIVMYDTLSHIRHLYENIKYYGTALNSIDDVYYAFRFIDNIGNLIWHCPLETETHCTPTNEERVYKILHNIELTKTKSYKNYCALTIECYRHLMKLNTEKDIGYPTEHEIIEYSKKKRSSDGLFDF